MNDSLLRDRVDDFGRSLFEAADEERPREDAQKALLASLALASAAGVIHTAGSSAPVATKVAASSFAGAAKWLVLGAMIAAPVAWYTSRPAQAPRTLASPPSAMPSMPMAVSVPVSAPVSVSVSAPSTEPAPLKAAPAAPTKSLLRTPVASPASSAAPTASATRADAPDAPALTRALADQVQLLDDARRHLRDGDPAAALASLDTFDRRHGDRAALAPEARAIRADARRAARTDVPSP